MLQLLLLEQQIPMKLLLLSALLQAQHLLEQLRLNLLLEQHLTNHSNYPRSCRS